MKASVVKMIKGSPSLDPRDSFVTKNYRRPAMLFEFALKDKIEKDQLYKVDIFKKDTSYVSETYFLKNGIRHNHLPKE